MAQTCDICGKAPQFGNRISHAHNLTKRRWNPNLRRVRAIVNGAHKTLRVCTGCIRGGKVVKPS
jgi:large subunit ribosomal protein L28